MEAAVVKLLVSVVVHGLIFGGLVWLARRGQYPVLDEPDPVLAPRATDRLRYTGSVVAALLFGGFAAAALWSVPSPDVPQAIARHAAYDEPAGRLLGPFFFGLACAAWVAYPLAARWVAPGPLQHFLWRSSAMWRRMDPRPVTRTTARFVVFLALVLHFAIRDQHTTFTAEGITWRDWPWQAEQQRAWQDVAEVQIVATFVAPSGQVRERPHLRLQFRAGEPMVMGQRMQEPAAFWERLAAVASDRAGVPIRRVDR